MFNSVALTLSLSHPMKSASVGAFFNVNPHLIVSKDQYISQFTKSKQNVSVKAVYAHSMQKKQERIFKWPFTVLFQQALQCQVISQTSKCVQVKLSSLIV